MTVTKGLMLKDGLSPACLTEQGPQRGGSASAAGYAAQHVGACRWGGTAFPSAPACPGFASFLPDDWVLLLHPTGHGVKVPLSSHSLLPEGVQAEGHGFRCSQEHHLSLGAVTSLYLHFWGAVTVFQGRHSSSRRGTVPISPFQHTRDWAQPTLCCLRQLSEVRGVPPFAQPLRKKALQKVL